MPIPMAPSPTNPTLFGLGISGFCKPAQTLFSSAFGAIFASEPSVVMKGVDQLKEVSVINLPDVRFAPIRDTCDLEVPDFREIFFCSAREIAAHDLGVIPIELDLQRRMR